ncbi:MAG: mechanosensitive ion channel family protein [Pseudomonadota bacterium]|nr:mechanosensitive ion channel family protein [Pseudomonadota bacterium]MDP1572885.1 mechanosensitive ion channel family protein [Pseudomonadota bacterium]MDP1905822.1 mechanosensitive ion channel family protein [Pseudomonadota bacterium]
MDFLSVILKDFGEWRELALVLIRIGVILAIAWGMLSLSHRLIPMLRIQLQKHTDDPEQQKRLETLGRVTRYTAGVVITLITGMLVLTELGISIAPILASAGIVGLAIGFGAQSLVKDYFNGLFLLLENQIHQGDVVEVAGKGGLVEEVTLRYIRLRDYEGTVHYVPNSAVTTVSNRSRGFAFAVVDVGVAYRENVEEVFQVIREVAIAMRADTVLGPLIIEDLDLAGVDAWADSAVMIRFRVKVKPLQQWTVKREFLRRLKAEFDQRGIEIPFPHLTLYAGQAKDGSAPPLQLLNQS